MMLYYAGICQEMAEEWHLVWYASAAVCITSGTSFALFAGRSVTAHRSAGAPATVTQSVEAEVSHSEHRRQAALIKCTEEEADVMRPCLPLMTQDQVPPPRYVELAAPVDNHHTMHHQHPSQPAAETSVQQTRLTHSHVISIV